MGTAGNRTGLKLFSFNTSVRNPKRNYDFLSIFEKYNNLVMDDDQLYLYYFDLIQNGVYVFTDISEAIKEKLAKNEKLDAVEVRRLIESNPQATGTSGRVMTELRALKDQGFLKFENGDHRKYRISLTKLGQELLYHPENGSIIYTKAMIGTEGFSPIRTTMLNKSVPFLNTLFVIDGVNNKLSEMGFSAKGILWHEFAAFVLSMKDCNWKQAVDLIVANRLRNGHTCNIDEIDEYLSENGILPYSKDTLYAYYDDVFRKFEMTELFVRHGFSKNTYINFSEYSIEKIKTLLSEYNNYHYILYQNVDDYYNAMANIVLPWERDEKIKRKIVIAKAKNMGVQFDSELDLDDQEETVDRIYYKNALKRAIDQTDLNVINRELLILNREIKEESNAPFSEYSEPVRLEYLVTLLIGKVYGIDGLVPNMKFSEDGLPLHCASGNKCDLKFFNQDGAYIFEPTMQRGKDQQLNSETTNVVRHIKNEESVDQIEYRAAMIAPYVHPDVAMFFKFQAISENVRIIPITISKFVSLININDTLGKLNVKFDEIIDYLRATDTNTYADTVNKYSALDVFLNNTQSVGSECSGFEYKLRTEAEVLVAED